VNAGLGKGLTGVVYEEEDTLLGRTVALKLLRPHIAIEPDAARRFIQKARAASALNHINIGTTFETGEIPPLEASETAGREIEGG